LICNKRRLYSLNSRDRAVPTSSLFFRQWRLVSPSRLHTFRGCVRAANENRRTSRSPRQTSTDCPPLRRNGTAHEALVPPRLIREARGLSGANCALFSKTSASDRLAYASSIGNSRRVSCQVRSTSQAEATLAGPSARSAWGSATWPIKKTNGHPERRREPEGERGA
jgi:hypothetical protein